MHICLFCRMSTSMGTHALNTSMHTTMHIVVANVRRRIKPTKNFPKNYISAQDLVFFRTFFWRKT